MLFCKKNEIALSRKARPPMPITSFADISLSHIFQELPYLVECGLFVDVSGYGTASDDSTVGRISLTVTTYTDTDGNRLTHSRLLRKMMNLPACVLPCSYCTPSKEELNPPATCPLCLAECPSPHWKKETIVAKLTLLTTGEITVDSPFAQPLHAFLAPLIMKQVRRFEERQHNIIRVFEEYEQAKLRKRKSMEARKLTEV